MNGLIDTQLYFGIPNQQPVGEDEDEEAIGWIVCNMAALLLPDLTPIKHYRIYGRACWRNLDLARSPHQGLSLVLLLIPQLLGWKYSTQPTRILIFRLIGFILVMEITPT